MIRDFFKPSPFLEYARRRKYGASWASVKAFVWDGTLRLGSVCILRGKLCSGRGKFESVKMTCSFYRGIRSRLPSPILSLGFRVQH